MRQNVEARAPFVVGAHDVPGSVVRIRCLEHLVARARVLKPSFTRWKVHVAKLPLPDRIFDTRFEATLLFLVADLEPVLEEENSVIGDLLLELRTDFEKALPLL